MRPVLIAGGFGLVHGLAFASAISGVGLDRTSLVATLLGFNVGIELTQLGVVALLMPSLLVLARTKAVGDVVTGARPKYLGPVVDVAGDARASRG